MRIQTRCVISERNMNEIPFTLEEFTSEDDPRRKVRVQPINYVLFAECKELLTRIYNLKFRPGDIVLITTPKSGTHWLIEMLWTMINNVDTEAAKKDVHWERAPMLEINHIDIDVVKELKEKRQNGEKLMPMEDFWVDYDSLKKFEALPSPRVCFTHLPIPMLPPNMLEVCKVIYLTRNPADVICSYHQFMHDRCHLHVDFDTFFNMFLDGTVLFTPYWSSVKEGWKIRNHPNALFLLYEEMAKDLRGCIEKISHHIQCPLSEEQIDKLQDHLSFENMKKNPAINMTPLAGTAFMKKGGNVVRKGKIGDSKTTLSEEQNKRLKDWCEANREECDIKFPGSDF
nr:sulfotransferase 4 [Vargula tsujii]